MKHKRAVHEGLKYPCGQYGNNFLRREFLLNTKGECMKESNTLVGNAANNYLTREFLLNTKGQYMKDSNTLVGNAANNFLGGEVLLNTKGQYLRTQIPFWAMRPTIFSEGKSF